MKEKEPMLQKHGFFFYPLHRNKANPQITNKRATSRQKEAALYSNI